MKNKRLFIIAALFLCYFLSASLPLDPDFGWHLAMGKHISQYGIPSTDPFSYTMPTYPFVDHEWLTNLCYYFLHTRFPLLLTLLSSLLPILAVSSPIFVYFSKEKKTNISKKNFIWGLYLLILASILPFSSGVRPQLISWVYFSILTIILYYKHLWHRYRLFIPFLLLLWSNTHGTFGVGAMYLLGVITLRNILRKKIDKSDLLVILSTLLVTFVNPYGPRMWWELWMQATDTSLRWRIQEWMPSVFMMNGPFLLYLVISVILFTRYIKKVPFEWVIVYFGLLTQATISLRNIPVWLIVTFPITLTNISLFHQDKAMTKEVMPRLELASKFFLKLSFVVSIVGIVIVIHGVSKSTESKFYPKNAVYVLKELSYSGNFYAPYNWGGYLIWNYPKKKVYIDGRMPSWRREDAPFGETNNAMEDYIEMNSDGVKFNEEIQKYEITTLLLPSGAPALDPVANWINKLFAHTEQDSFSLPSDLDPDLWDEIYKDEVAVIYRYNRVNE